MAGGNGGYGYRSTNGGRLHGYSPLAEGASPNGLGLMEPEANALASDGSYISN